MDAVDNICVLDMTIIPTLSQSKIENHTFGRLAKQVDRSLRIVNRHHASHTRAEFPRMSVPRIHALRPLMFRFGEVTNVVFLDTIWATEHGNGVMSPCT